MSTKILPSDLPIHPFKSASDFETFLERQHFSCRGIYLKLAKKSSGLPSITFDEATEVALCFGWINGQGKPFNDCWSLSRFTPRRPKSLWSKRNVEIVARLVETGRMRPAGLAAVDAAKADGRWDRAYAGPASIEVPEDFAAELAKNPAAALFFESLNKTCRYAVLWRVQTASPQNRAKRIGGLVKTLTDRKVPGRSEPGLKVPTKTNERASKPRKPVLGVPKAHKKTKISLPSDKDQANEPRRTGLRPRR